MTSKNYIFYYIQQNSEILEHPIEAELTSAKNKIQIQAIDLQQLTEKSTNLEKEIIQSNTNNKAQSQKLNHKIKELKHDINRLESEHKLERIAEVFLSWRTIGVTSL